MKTGSNPNAATTLWIFLFPPSSCTSVPETQSWPVSTTNANTGARRRRNPTSSSPFVQTIERRVRQALAVIETLMRVLVLTVRIKNIIESREKSTCDSVEMSSSEVTS